MFNGVLLVAIIATWIVKVTSLPKLYHHHVLMILVCLNETVTFGIQHQFNNDTPSPMGLFIHKI